MMQLIKDLWFKRRDIVSQGFDESLEYIAKQIPLKVHKVPSGTECFTWIVPEKWEVKQAFVEDGEGKKIIDAKDHPLHVMSYSLPIDRVVSREELLRHLHSRPGRPDAIPFEFKYYERDWGLCIQHSRLKELKESKYRVLIDSSFEKGSLKIGECLIKGKTDETIVLVAHLCHPCMANDDLSGVAVLVETAKELLKAKPKYTYSCLFLPETIGSIAFLSQNMQLIPNLKYGIFLEMLGSNSNTLALQHSRQGNSAIDRIAKFALESSGRQFREGAFREIVGNDEMVFNGPGINIPMISLSRYPYPEYHTSDDNLGIISEEKLNEAKEAVLRVVEILEKDFVPKRKFIGPVFLSRYGLWVDWRKDFELNRNIEKIMLSLEGDKSVFEIAAELGMGFEKTLAYVEKFLEKGLVEKLEAKKAAKRALGKKKEKIGFRKK